MMANDAGSRRPVARALTVLISVAAGLMLVGCSEDEPEGDVAASTALLLETADCGDTVAAKENVSVTTSTFEDDLAGKISVIRRWRTPGSGDGFQLRQDVLTLPDSSSAHEAFEDHDPSPGYREDLGGAEPLSVAGAAHADEAVGYCAPIPTGCILIHYSLRYGTNVIDLSLDHDGIVSTSAEGYLRRLDAVVSQRRA